MFSLKYCNTYSDRGTMRGSNPVLACGDYCRYPYHFPQFEYLLFGKKGFLSAISLPMKPCLAASLANMCEIALLIMAANIRNMVLIKF